MCFRLPSAHRPRAAAAGSVVEIPSRDGSTAEPGRPGPGQRLTSSSDWMHRDAARARMRVLVKRILRKYGYPPDLQDAAVQTVLQQAEALSAEWAKPA